MEIYLKNISISKDGNYELIPNINNTSRILPTSISADEIKDNPLDCDAKSRKLTDKEIYPLIIQIDEQEVKTNPNLKLELFFDDILFGILNQSGIPLIKEKGNTDLLSIDLIEAFKKNTKAEGITFYIECKSFANSPLLMNTSLQDLRCFITDGNGKVIKQFPKDYSNRIIPCKLFLIGDDAPPEQVFMCDVDENKPSIEDVTIALKEINVPLTLIPLDVNNGDSWIQDQFQFAAAINDNTKFSTILHLPRMANDSALFHSTPNLKNFVEKFFPSYSIGLFNDFWKIFILLSDGSTSFEFKLIQTFKIYNRHFIVIRFLKNLINLASKNNFAIAKQYMNFEFTNIFLVRIKIEELSEFLLMSNSVKADDKIGIRQSIEKINSWFNYNKTKEEVQLTINIIDDNQKEVVLKFNFLEINKANLNVFFAELRKIHSSLGYGGNIEISPPWKDYKHGKIITGSFINNSLEKILSTNIQKQPLCKVYTEWLEVGHIDEIMGFVKDTNAASGFSIVRAAPQLARNLLKEIINYKNEKNILVTRLFRGKKWIHEQIPSGDKSHTPPNTYKKYVELAKEKYDLSGFDKDYSSTDKVTFYDSAFHDDRKFIIYYSKKGKVKTKYAAFISCEDILNITALTNSRIENLFLSGGDVHYDPEMYEGNYLSDNFRKNIFPYRLDKIIQAEFPESKIIQIPVLFDYAVNFNLNQIKAVIPDCANFQSLNNNILMPRPYGPRMKMKDAVLFMKDYFDKNRITSSLTSKLNEQFIVDLGLNRVFHWSNNVFKKNEPFDWSRINEPRKQVHFESISIANPSKQLTEFDGEKEYTKFLFETDIFNPNYNSGYSKNLPVRNHPIEESENLRLIATYFKDGFDEFKNYPVDFCAGDTTDSHPKLDTFEKNIKKVEEVIKKANIGIFDNKGNIVPSGWTKITIPENTVDVFELYIQLVLASTNVKIHWVDSWYYHVHSGGIHCGTNVIRKL